MAELVESIPVEHDGTRVRVLFYEDGSIRFRIHEAGPMHISEAFLSGQDKHVIIKLVPGS